MEIDNSKHRLYPVVVFWVAKVDSDGFNRLLSGPFINRSDAGDKLMSYNNHFTHYTIVEQEIVVKVNLDAVYTPQEKR